ncbi:MAG TPA: arylsulfatase, partial [Prolixibacteraceae bacterium]|nr:arylsulfatase [Prolixibacteraceae bacterium]
MNKTILPVITGLSCGALVTQATPAQKPNILIIVADDMGYSDAGCYGGEIKTPVLDGLASRGLRFTQFYNTGRCWPSRSSLLTGYYPQAIRRDNLTGFQRDPKVPTGGAGGIRPRWAQLLPVYLKPLDYRSYVSGKWHVDGKPLQNGFDHSFITSNDFGFFRAADDTRDDVKQPPVPEGEGSYSTIRIADHAIQFLKEHAAKYPGQPFFQYLAFHSPHFPIHALPEDIAVYNGRYQSGWDALREERFKRMKEMGLIHCSLSPLDPEIIPAWNFPEAKLKQMIGENEVAYAFPWNTLSPGQKEFQAKKMAVHAAMVHRMDMEIGRVLDQIRSMGVLDNTIVIFVSDNGASAEQIIRGDGHDPTAPVGSSKSYLGIGPGWSGAANTPFRLHKSWNHEGGIATPFIVCWPAGIKARGEIRNNPGHLVDLVPTLLDITGGKVPSLVSSLEVPPLPGKSLVPAFKKDGSVKHRYLWWNHEGN